MAGEALLDYLVHEECDYCDIMRFNPDCSPIRHSPPLQSYTYVSVQLRRNDNSLPSDMDTKQRRAGSEHKRKQWTCAYFMHVCLCFDLGLLGCCYSVS